MKSKILLFLMLFTFSLTLNAQDLKCNKFKSGRFYYPSLPGKISVMTDSITKSYNNGNLEMIWKVRWLSECKYELTCIEILNNNLKSKVGDRIEVTIIKIEGSCFYTSLMFYNSENPKGKSVPSSQICLENN